MAGKRAISTVKGWRQLALFPAAAIQALTPSRYRRIQARIAQEKKLAKQEENRSASQKEGANSPEESR